MQLNTKLRTLRKAMNMTLAQVSNQTGLSVSFISDIERGRTNASLETLHKLAACYNIPTSELLQDTGLDTGTAHRRLPKGLDEFIEQNPEIDEGIKELLISAESRALARYQSIEDWRELYYALKRIYNKR